MGDYNGHKMELVKLEAQLLRGFYNSWITSRLGFSLNFFGQDDISTGIVYINKTCNRISEFWPLVASILISITQRCPRCSSSSACVSDGGSAAGGRDPPAEGLTC